MIILLIILDFVGKANQKNWNSAIQRSGLYMDMVPLSRHEFTRLITHS
jgi:hypothetical protein